MLEVQKLELMALLIEIRLACCKFFTCPEALTLNSSNTELIYCILKDTQFSKRMCRLETK
ncbi:MAG: hypothetical protein CMR00_11165 [[Chlorobium] sp. 445]|nr:MAG: hypothetical protein CMR00_11165 [[Chlorobium] sp. 445]